MSAFGNPFAVSSVPSSGSTAMSTCGGEPSPICSPLKSIGASSFSPSPITTTPSIEMLFSASRIASTAAPSASSFSPLPIQRAAASAPYSVTRTSSIAMLRSGTSASFVAGDQVEVAVACALSCQIVPGGLRARSPSAWRMMPPAQIIAEPSRPTM